MLWEIPFEEGRGAGITYTPMEISPKWFPHLSLTTTLEGRTSTAGFL
jgi:hypothetical protein